MTEIILSRSGELVCTKRTEFNNELGPEVGEAAIGGIGKVTSLGIIGRLEPAAF